MKRFLSVLLLLTILLGLIPAQVFAAATPATVDAHIHEYASSVTDPTCTEQGYTTYTCQCGDSYVDEYVDATGEHTYVNGICTGCGEAQPGPVITQQPADVKVARFERLSVSVEATGDGLSYQWYYKDPSMKIFRPTANKTATYSYVMAAHMAGRQVYCVITDAYGNQVRTPVATIRLK